MKFHYSRKGCNHDIHSRFFIYSWPSCTSRHRCMKTCLRIHSALLRMVLVSGCTSENHCFGALGWVPNCCLPDLPYLILLSIFLDLHFSRFSNIQIRPNSSVLLYFQNIYSQKWVCSYIELKPLYQLNKSTSLCIFFSISISISLSLHDHVRPEIDPMSEAVIWFCQQIICLCICLTIYIIKLKKYFVKKYSIHDLKGGKVIVEVYK